MKIKTKLFLFTFSLSFSLALLTSLLFYWDSSRQKFEDLRKEITALARAAALLVDEPAHARLARSMDASSPEYREIWTALSRFTATNPKILYVYTMVKSTRPGIWRFVVDADIKEDLDGDGAISDDEMPAPPGEEYDVTPYPEMRHAFEGPLADSQVDRDKWGWVLSAYAPILDAGGKATAIVGIDVSADTIRAERDSLKTRIALIFAVTLIVSLLLSSVLAGSLTKPLLKVIEAARAIASGDFVTLPKARRRDEIGLLLGSIDTMSRNIKTTIDKLRTLNRTAEILKLTLDLDEALKLSVNLSLEVLGASRVVILLYDEKENRFVPGALSGIENATVLEGAVLVGEKRVDLEPQLAQVEKIARRPGLHGAAALRDDPDLPFFAAWLEATATRVLCPLIVKSEMRGAVLLDAEIPDEDYALAFLGQVALSLENARLYHEAIADGLTRLYVHRYFQVQLSAEVRRSRRYERDFSLLMIDLDHFKKVNDTHGHPAGDAVLRHVAALVRQTLRATDVPSRYGGEEFVVILPETAREHAEKVAEKIRAMVQESPTVYKDLSIPVTVSIGVATWSHEKPVAPETLISRADESVYRAKTEGRNRVCVFGSS